MAPEAKAKDLASEAKAKDTPAGLEAKAVASRTPSLASCYNVYYHNTSNLCNYNNSVHKFSVAVTGRFISMHI